MFQDFCEDPPNITYTGTSHWFAANGDELSGTFEGFLSPTETPGVYDNHETSDVTGGTGRFASATGHTESGGQIDITAEPLFFALPFQGWISSVGSNRHVEIVRLIWHRSWRSSSCDALDRRRDLPLPDSASGVASPEQNPRQCHW